MARNHEPLLGDQNASRKSKGYGYLLYTEEVKYLDLKKYFGLNLDDKLTWNVLIQETTNGS